jgi:cytochrome c2
VAMYVRARATGAHGRAPVASRLAAALVALVVLAVLFFGVYPRPLVTLSERAAAAVEVSSVSGAGKIPPSLRPSPAPSPAGPSASASPSSSATATPSSAASASPVASPSVSPSASAAASPTPSPSASASPSPSSATGAAAGDAAKGQSLFASLGCSNCHSISGQTGAGPSLKGVAGSTVQLTTGQSVTADDAYLLRSIEQPDAQIVQGFSKGVMSGVIKPGSVSQADAQALVAYIKTLK